MAVYVNRILNLKRIKAIGFDLDYTLARYQTKKFEELVYQQTIDRLITQENFPTSIRSLKFTFNLVIQGLVLDVKEGNLLKLSLYSKVKTAYHGTHPIDFKTQQTMYESKAIDLQSPQFKSMDTSFSISLGMLYAQLVDLADEGKIKLSYEQIAQALTRSVNFVHGQGELKKIVQANLADYIIPDPQTTTLLKRLRAHGKKLFIATNSDFDYATSLLQFVFGTTWAQLFDLVIFRANKPDFFFKRHPFLAVDPASGLLQNFDGALKNGMYQGGNATQIEHDLHLQGPEILYLGDHIFGDILTLKRHLAWRTGLIVEALALDATAQETQHGIQEQIDQAMHQKESLELELNKLYDAHIEKQVPLDRQKVDQLFGRIDHLDRQLQQNIAAYQEAFNPYWGELFRAGNEASLLAGQVEKYACIYMPYLHDLADYSPRTYFRPQKKLMAHERPGKTPPAIEAHD